MKRTYVFYFPPYINNHSGNYFPIHDADLPVNLLQYSTYFTCDESQRKKSNLYDNPDMNIQYMAVTCYLQSSFTQSNGKILRR